MTATLASGHQRPLLTLWLREKRFPLTRVHRPSRSRNRFADLLFKSAAASLRRTIRSQQDYDPATRYLTGGPISDSRILAADASEVTFLAREGKRVGGQREQVPVTIPTLEFVRRWCEHIQPDQLTKPRQLYLPGLSPDSSYLIEW